MPGALAGQDFLDVVRNLMGRGPFWLVEINDTVGEQLFCRTLFRRLAKSTFGFFLDEEFSLHKKEGPRKQFKRFVWRKCFLPLQFDGSRPFGDKPLIVKNATPRGRRN